MRAARRCTALPFFACTFFLGCPACSTRRLARALTRRLRPRPYRRVTYNPAGAMKKGSDGKLHLRRVYGLKVCSYPGFGKVMHRDLMAAMSINKNAHHLCDEGEVPVPFRHSTKYTELDYPASTRYKYKYVPSKPRYTRFTSSS